METESVDGLASEHTTTVYRSSSEASFWLNDWIHTEEDGNMEIWNTRIREYGSRESGYMKSGNSVDDLSRTLD